MKLTKAVLSPGLNWPFPRVVSDQALSRRHGARGTHQPLWHIDSIPIFVPLMCFSLKDPTAICFHCVSAELISFPMPPARRRRSPLLLLHCGMSLQCLSWDPFSFQVLSGSQGSVSLLSFLKNLIFQCLYSKYWRG